MFAGFVWDLDPTILHLGPLQLRYYGIIFATMLLIGYVLWRKQMTRGGYSEALAEKFLIWGVFAVLLGSRFGHVFFYEWDYYRQNPGQIIAFWRGGLASHGATIGLIVSLFFFSRKYKIHFIEVLDRFSMSAAVGAAAVRLGNFFNSEIVGRVTDVPWAVNFTRYEEMRLRMEPAYRQIHEQPVYRHPSQLYEFTLGLFVLLVLYLADRFAGGEKRPRGLLAALFMMVYFAGRFTVEFFKEYQTGLQAEAGLTMGQYLSIIPFLLGVALLVWTVINRHRDWPRPEPVPVEPSGSGNRSSKGKKRGSSKKKR